MFANISSYQNWFIFDKKYIYFLNSKFISLVFLFIVIYDISNG